MVINLHLNIYPNLILKDGLYQIEGNIIIRLIGIF
jgi:hypothetical protein